MLNSNPFSTCLKHEPDGYVLVFFHKDMPSKLLTHKCFILVFLCNIECCFSTEDAAVQISLYYMILIVLLYFFNLTSAFTQMVVSPEPGFAGHQPVLIFAEREGWEDQENMTSSGFFF